jgi:hypothetical protein
MRQASFRTEKIDITNIYKLKVSSRSYYITIPIELIRQYDLVPGHFLKLKFIEVRKPFEEEVVE